MPLKNQAENRAYHREYNHLPDRKAYRKEWYLKNREAVIAKTLERRRQLEADAAEQAVTALAGLGSNNLPG